MIKWKRPDNIPFPQVWWKFSAKDPDTGDTIDYRIEDLTEDRYEEVVDLMINRFVPDEPMCCSLGIPKDEVSLEEMRGMWKEAVTQKLTLVCYKENSSEICGLNVLEMNFKSSNAENQPELNGKGAKEVFIVFDLLKEKANVYNSYNVDEYLHGLGLLTLPKYRGCGIATELLKARFPLMKALGLTVTGTVFSGPGSQGAARKAGFREDVVLTYESLARDEPLIEFPNIKWPVVKFMTYHLQ
uniref:N-acetyltransferase domain-containing protein n=1 Tax=Nyssomyia neivai TaxID=330878 RepID=A0A1L8DAF7_9DIPT